MVWLMGTLNLSLWVMDWWAPHWGPVHTWVCICPCRKRRGKRVSTTPAGGTCTCSCRRSTTRSGSTATRRNCNWCWRRPRAWPGFPAPAGRTSTCSCIRPSAQWGLTTPQERMCSWACTRPRSRSRTNIPGGWTWNYYYSCFCTGRSHVSSHWAHGPNGSATTLTVSSISTPSMHSPTQSLLHSTWHIFCVFIYLILSFFLSVMLFRFCIFKFKIKH